MNWFKENPFLAGVAAVCLVGSVVLGYLIFQAASSYTASSEACTEAIAKLHTLQNKAPFPSEANLKAIQSGLDDYAKSINDLRSQLAKMEVPLDTKITAQQFQDGLRSAVNDIRSKAETNGVKLPANFYFGFDQYQTQVPTEYAAPFLHRQFRVIQSIVERLVDFKVASIDGIARASLPQELGTGAPTSGKEKKEASEVVVSRAPFDIAFSAEQGKFRVAFNSLLGADQFLVIRSLGIQNSNPQAPSKKNTESASSPQRAAAGVVGGQFPPPNKDQESLRVILGRELLKVTLRLEILDFPEAVASKK